jgi:hypothetical protein
MGLEWKSVEAFPELAALLQHPALDGSSVAFLKGTQRCAQMFGGLTNRLYCCEAEEPLVTGSSSQDRWVVRVSGDNVAVHFIDRDREFQCLQAGYAAGVTPKSYFNTELKLLCQALVDGETFDEAKVQAHIPQAMAVVKKLHSQPLSAFPAHVFDVFDVIEHYVEVARGHGAPLPNALNTARQIAEKAKEAMGKGTLGTLPKVLATTQLTGISMFIIMIII